MAVASGPNTLPVMTVTLNAAEDLSSNQFYGVAISGDRAVDLVDGVTDRPVGILQNKPTSGQDAEIIVIGKVKIIATETISAGDQIRIHSDGKAAIFAPDTDSTAYCIGQCTLGADASELIEAIISCTALDRGEE